MSEKNSAPGYNPRTTVTFTPGAQAQWTERFNQLLYQLNQGNFKVSRNALTERLIEEGLKSYDATGENKTLIINCKDYTEEQIELLRTTAGQQIIKNVLNLLIGNNNAIISIPGVSPSPTKAYVAKEQEAKEIHSVVDIDITTHRSVDEHPPFVTNETTPEKVREQSSSNLTGEDAPIKRMSAAEKLNARRRAMQPGGNK